MPRPIRKMLQRSSLPRDTPRRFTFRLSGVAVLALGLALTAAVGWAFFMGFMVGRGQNPERRVEQMTGMLREEQAPPALPVPQALAPTQEVQEAQGMPPAPPGAAQTAAPGPAASGPAASGQAASPKDAQNAQKTEAKPAYPFNRPQGDGLAAWGIPPAITAQNASGQSTAGQNTAGAAATGQMPNAQPTRATPQAQQGAQQSEPLFDYVYQAAAFRDKADADRLRARLEGKGLRTRQQKSGTVLLVLINLRGTDLDAANLSEELQRMKLGKPMQLSKKAVPGKSRKTGR